MSYRILVLPDDKTMTPATLRKVKELVEAGATVVGSKPLRSPSLSDYPKCDAEIQQLADGLWGRGLVARSVDKALAKLKLRPDFAFDKAIAPLAYIHRVADGADLYFVSNQSDKSVEIPCTFRVAGKVPELWHPDTGRIERAPVFDAHDDRTTVPLRFDPAGSVFVVFRRPDASDHLVSLRWSGKSNDSPPSPVFDLAASADGMVNVQAWQPGVLVAKTAVGETLKADVSEVPNPREIAGPWEVHFPPKWHAPEKITLDRLISWTECPDSGVKYFSGTATYVKQFDLPASAIGSSDAAYLDLGRVKNIAEVKLNGRELGILWKPPFRADITGAVKPGRNTLEIRITNLWPNRLIGDERLPADCDWSGDALKSLPQWLLEGKPNPTNRLTFATWRLWKKDEPLLPSGLLGPVVLRTASSVALSPER